MKKSYGKPILFLKNIPYKLASTLKSSKRTIFERGMLSGYSVYQTVRPRLKLASRQFVISRNSVGLWKTLILQKPFYCDLKRDSLP